MVHRPISTCYIAMSIGGSEGGQGKRGMGGGGGGFAPPEPSLAPPWTYRTILVSETGIMHTHCTESQQENRRQQL